MKKIIIITILGLAPALYSADVVLFPRSTGYPYYCPVPKTGQTNSSAINDDGWNSTNTGIAWPTTRFTVQDNTNCVRDNLTGLIWARNANLNSTNTWSNQIEFCESLDYGGQTDWRLPNRSELFSLLNVGGFVPTLPAGHPFANVQANFYWASSSFNANSLKAWVIGLDYGAVEYVFKTISTYCAWPVRGP